MPLKRFLIDQSQTLIMNNSDLIIEYIYHSLSVPQCKFSVDKSITQPQII